MLRRALPRVFDHIRRYVCKNEPHRSIFIVVSPLTALIQVSKYGSASTMADHRHWQREAEGQPLVYSASSHLTALIKSPADYDCAFHNNRIYDVVRTKLSINSYQTLLSPCGWSVWERDYTYTALRAWLFT